MPATANVESTVRKPVAQLASFGQTWGIPLVAGVAGFAAGDVLNIGGVVASRAKVQTVSVVGFTIDVSKLFAIFVYAMIAVIGLSFGRKLHPVLGRSILTFFAGAILRMVLEMTGITQNIVEVA
jgi:hypothetical protein